MMSSAKTSVSTNTTYWVKLNLSAHTSHSAISIIFANRFIYSTVILLLLVAPLGKLFYSDVIFNKYDYQIVYRLGMSSNGVKYSFVVLTNLT